MTIKTRSVEYEQDGAVYEGLMATDADAGSPRPAVIIAHAWGGRSDGEDKAAKWIASLGYAGFALDLYGKGKRGETKEECEALMTPFMEDRAMLQSRLLSTIDFVQGLSDVHENKIAAIGFCFGGLCALDIARSSRDVRGVASIHGLLSANGLGANNKIKARVIAYHGWDDPMAPPDHVLEFTKEMTERGADWQLHAFGNTMHAFTNPAAADPGFGTVYNKAAADRSFTSLQNFLQEIFN